MGSNSGKLMILYPKACNIQQVQHYVNTEWCNSSKGMYDSSSRPVGMRKAET